MLISKTRLKRILTLALPIIGGMLSQNVLNLVDTAMVGVLGDTALAAVTLGGIANFFVSAFILGLGAGVQAMVAHRRGEREANQDADEHAVAEPLNGGLLVALVVATPWAVVLWFLIPVVFPLLDDDQAVVAEGIPYLQMRILALTALAMNFCFRGFWNSTDRAGLYMRTLVLMHLVNIGLNWVFIYGNLGAPEMGAPGAGLASAISTWCGVLYYFYLAFTHARNQGFLRRLPERATLAGIVRLSVPTGLQNVFFAGGMGVFQLMVAAIGTQELAASGVIVNLLLVGILPGLGFGLASMSLVGQALGRGDKVDARRWGWEVGRVGAVSVGIIALPGVFFPDLLLSGFLNNPETLALAVTPLRIVSLSMTVDALGLVLMNSLFGAGDNKRVAIIATLLQWGLFLPTVYVLINWFDGDLTTVWVANVVYRMVQSTVYVSLWRGTKWTENKL